jgi:hypothetical protein
MALPHHPQAEHPDAHLDEHPRGIPTAREAAAIAALWLAAFIVLPFLAGALARALT